MKTPKKGKHPLHSQSLTNNPSGQFRKLCPVGTKLKFHGNSCNHAHGKVQGEDLHPKFAGIIVNDIITAQKFPLKIDNHQR